MVNMWWTANSQSYKFTVQYNIIIHFKYNIYSHLLLYTITSTVFNLALFSHLKMFPYRMYELFYYGEIWWAQNQRMMTLANHQGLQPLALLRVCLETHPRTTLRMSAPASQRVSRILHNIIADSAPTGKMVGPFQLASLLWCTVLFYIGSLPVE